MNAPRSTRTAPAALPETDLPDITEAAVARALPPLNSTARRALRADAHHLDPVVMIGDSGLTPGVIAETDRALTAHQLIKIRILGDDREVRRPMMEALCSALGCAPVQIIGKLLVVWRPLPVISRDEGFVPKKAAAQRAAARSGAGRKPQPAVTKRKPSGRPAKAAKVARSGDSGGPSRSGGAARSGGSSRSDRPARSGGPAGSGGFARAGGSGWSSGGERSPGGKPAGTGPSRGGFANPAGSRGPRPSGQRSGEGGGFRSTGSRPTSGGGFGPRRSESGDRDSFRSEGDRPTGGRPPRAGTERPARSSGSGFGRPQGSRPASGDRAPRQSDAGVPSRPAGARAGSARSGSARPGPARSGPARSGPARSGPARSGPARTAATKTPGRRAPARKR